MQWVLEDPDGRRLNGTNEKRNQGEMVVRPRCRSAMKGWAVWGAAIVCVLLGDVIVWILVLH